PLELADQIGPQLHRRLRRAPGREGEWPLRRRRRQDAEAQQVAPRQAEALVVGRSLHFVVVAHRGPPRWMALHVADGNRGARFSRMARAPSRTSSSLKVSISSAA